MAVDQAERTLQREPVKDYVPNQVEATTTSTTGRLSELQRCEVHIVLQEDDSRTRHVDTQRKCSRSNDDPEDSLPEQLLNTTPIPVLLAKSTPKLLSPPEAVGKLTVLYKFYPNRNDARLFPYQVPLKTLPQSPPSATFEDPHPSLPSNNLPSCSQS